MPWDAIAVAAAPTIAVVATWIMSRRKVREIHVMVNQQKTDMEREIESLKAEVANLKGLPPET